MKAAINRFLIPLTRQLANFPAKREMRCCGKINCQKTDEMPSKIMIPKKMNRRATAVNVLSDVIDKHHSLNSAIITKLPKNTADVPFIKELCFGTLRWYFRLQYLLSLLVSKPLKAKDADISILLLIGLYQLLYLRAPEHAVVTETVEAARVLNKPWATRLVNGVLRSFIRNKEELLSRLDESEEAVYSHPSWLINAIRTAWPTHYKEVLINNNEHPPFTLRVNKQKISRENYLAKLLSVGIEAEATTLSPHGIFLKQGHPVTNLPGFNEGEISVQDEAAQLAAELLELEPAQSVLDACAAPGGKTAHLGETEPNLAQLIAIDSDGVRLKLAKENWLRLKLPPLVTWITRDATQTSWWDGKDFDRILLDAPCSATGVIRRHPDIKLLRKKSDIDQLMTQQMQLLENLWSLLKPGGLLLYVTCSVLPEENSQLVGQFMANHSDAIERPIHAEWGIPTKIGRQILPTSSQGMDGFYFAKLQKLLNNSHS